MRYSAVLLVLAACVAGATAAPSPPSPVIPEKDYVDSIEPVIKFIATGTPPAVNETFFKLLGPYGPLPGLQKASIVLQWHELLLAAVRAYTKTYSGFPTAIARALFITQTSVYDAWAAYDDTAIGLYSPSTFRRPPSERKQANRETAVSFAAYQAIVNLFPGAQPVVLDFLKAKTPQFSNSLLTCNNLDEPACLGNVAASNVIEARENDGSNQKNNYADTPPLFVYPDPKNLSAWQRLPGQTASTPQWRRVKPFALKRANQFVPPDTTTFLFDKEPGETDYKLQADAILAYSTTLDDRTKVIGDYWADFKASNLPPGHWTQFAEYVLLTREYSLDEEVKMLFALTAALLDASISAWDTKYQYVSVRPITAIRYLYDGKQIAAYQRDNVKSPVFEDGADWEPFQPASGITPPFPAFVSGHSTFGGAFEIVMQNLTGSDTFGLSITVPAGFLVSEDSDPKADPPRIVPAEDVTLYYPTFSYASEENGISRLYNGVHFVNDNIYGRAQGKAAGKQAFQRAWALFRGKDISADAPESPDVRRTFHESIQSGTTLPSGHKVRLQVVA